MVTAETFEAWRLQKVEMENEYSYMSDPIVDLNKSQVFLSSIDELYDDRNPCDILFRPTTLSEGR
jgi:hypothetical protein